MPWEITQTKRGWLAEDAERDIVLTAPSREKLDLSISELEAVLVAPAPIREDAPARNVPDSRESYAALFYHLTGNRLPGCHYIPVPPQQDTIQHRFEKFHEANPHIYARLVEAARRLKAAGNTKIGIGHLVEDCIRWAEERTITNENYKISNDYRSRYARKIMDENPDLRGVFEIRELVSA
jgi:hypothetical protein